MILSVLGVPRGRLQLCLDIRSNRALMGPIYPNIVITSNVQLNWFMRFAMEFFYPISFGFQSNIGQYITKCNSLVLPKYQMSFEMNPKKTIDLN